jgi:hypothetical protein
MKNLKTLLEGSLLADIEDTIETGNKYEKVDLTSIFNSKSKEEFETKYNIFKSMVEEKNTEVSDIKPRKTYIAFVKYIPMTKEDQILCCFSVYIGTTTDLYRLMLVPDDRNGKARTIISKVESVGLDRFTKKYKNFEIAIYVCPKKIKDEANKLIIYNLE